MSDTKNQNDGVDPLAQTIVDAIRKSGGRASLGFPPPEAMERSKAEKSERDFQALKKREEAKGRRLAELKQAAMSKLRRTNER